MTLDLNAPENSDNITTTTTTIAFDTPTTTISSVESTPTPTLEPQPEKKEQTKVEKNPAATAQTVKVLVLILSFSDNGAATDIETLKSVIADPFSSNPTVASQIRFSSFGKLLLETEIRTLRLRKRDFRNRQGGWKFTGSNCPDNNIGFHAFTDGVLEDARKEMRDIDAFQHHWFVMDKAQQNRNEKCDYLGTGGSNRIVMQGNKKAWGSIQIWMHEFGHSLALGHASMMKNGKVDEYGDDSSAMNNQGAKQMPYSGFHTVILKWAKPRVQLLAKDISNIWQTIELQKMGHSDVFGLLVESVDGSGTKRNIFVSFRGDKKTKFYDVVRGEESPFPNEASNDSKYINGVQVQYLDGNWKNQKEGRNDPVFLAQTLKRVSEKYLDDKLNIVFQLQSINSESGTAVVQFCRKNSPKDCQ